MAISYWLAIYHYSGVPGFTSKLKLDLAMVGNFFFILVLYLGGSMAKWFRGLDLKSRGAQFKSSTLPLA